MQEAQEIGCTVQDTWRRGAHVGEAFDLLCSQTMCAMDQVKRGLYWIRSEDDAVVKEMSKATNQV